jgi:uncharacterized protein YdeI (YjbR/CyaY-like superfamily)
MVQGERETLVFRDAADWRDWLAGYHAQRDAVVLVIAKKGAEPPGLGYEAAVEEAMCHGWVDGKALSLDDRSFLLRFSPRRANSVWSISNIERVRVLTESGRMTTAGLAAVEAGKASGKWDAALRRELVDLIPDDVEAALLQHPGAREAYLTLTVSRRKQLLYLLETAKRPETRARRVRAIVDEVREAQGRAGG